MASNHVLAMSYKATTWRRVTIKINKRPCEAANDHEYTQSIFVRSFFLCKLYHSWLHEWWVNYLRVRLCFQMGLQILSLQGKGIVFFLELVDLRVSGMLCLGHASLEFSTLSMKIIMCTSWSYVRKSSVCVLWGQDKEKAYMCKKA